MPESAGSASPPAEPQVSVNDRPEPVEESPKKQVILPAVGESITSSMTSNTYTMGQRIGEGNFGVVFECVDVWRNRLAAKILKPTNTYEKVRASATEEFQKLVMLRHPNVTYLFDAFEFRDTFYLITERCDSSLAHVIPQGWFRGGAWIQPVARCLLQAVHFIHISGYCHQDIHLGNVFVAVARDEFAVEELQEGAPSAVQLKLGDLGVAKLFNELDGSNTRNLDIIPPEVLDKTSFGPLDHRIDIYHSGLLLLQLALSRELKFAEDDIKEGKPRQMALELSPPLNFALEKALRRHVAARTATAMELWRDINSDVAPLADETVSQLELPGTPGKSEENPQG